MLRFASSLLFLLTLSTSAQAGMVVLILTDVAKMRIESLSFFIASYLFMALVVKWLWNYLAKSFEKLPQLNYRRALALALISGLFLYVILTMISGARELLTPGAWQKSGYGYKLKSEDSTQKQPEDREGQAIDLSLALESYAKKHNNTLPTNLYTNEIMLTGAHKNFAYLAGNPSTSPPKLLAYEINTEANERLVILSDFSIQTWNRLELLNSLNHE